MCCQLTPDEIRLGLILVGFLMVYPIVFGSYICFQLYKYIRKYNKPGDFWRGF